jgi:hypothetical protein
MMDMQLDQNWALCGKDCTWCGHCAESYGYWISRVSGDGVGSTWEE